MTFQELVRQNTGSHMLDSGGAYGRQWQKPLPTYDIELELDEWTDNNGNRQCYVCPKINLSKFLDGAFDGINKELTKQLHDFANSDEHENESWYECIHAWLELHGYLTDKVDNSYNHETDLDQDFQLWSMQKDDECYGHSHMIIQTHNGCDIRGGYSAPVVVNLIEDNEWAWSEWTVAWDAVKGTDSNGKELSREQLQELDQHFQHGYSHYPTNEIKGEILKLETKRSMWVKLDSGETVLIEAYNKCLDGCY